MKKIFSFIILFIPFISQAGWVENSKVSGFYTFQTSKGEVAYYYAIPPQAKEESYNCGATIVQMQFIGETNKFNKSVKIDRNAIYKFVKKINNKPIDDESGITATELKKGIAVLSNILEKHGYKTSIDMIEQGSDSIKTAVKQIFDYLAKSKGPSILYGNVLDGFSGGHYYLIKGAAYCPSCTDNKDDDVGLVALFINDSVYNSDYYEGTVIGDNAIYPYTGVFLSSNWINKNNKNSETLDKYWNKTGPWYNKKHWFLSNNVKF